MHKPCSSSFKRMVLNRRTHICYVTGSTAKALTAFHSLVLLGILILGACAPVSSAPRSATPDSRPGTFKEPTLSIGAPCSRRDALQWAGDAQNDTGSALQAANCYLSLAKAGTDTSLRLADARMGRKLARTAVQREPGSGPAHYLYAYLTGLEAENDPLHGLQLVPLIEKEAQLAAKSAPSIDDGGPYRMLGELYLRTPGIPISIGDVDKAIACYRQALAMAPGSAENRLGLAEALLQAEEAAEACAQLHELLTGMPPAAESEATWRRALDLLKRLCAAKTE